LRRGVAEQSFTGAFLSFQTVLDLRNSDATLVLSHSFFTFLRHTFALTLRLLGSRFLFEPIHIHGVKSSGKRGGLQGERNSGFSELTQTFLRQSGGGEINRLRRIIHHRILNRSGLQFKGRFGKS